MPCHQGKHLVNIIIIPQQNYSLHSPFLQHSLILFLGATALAAPLGPEKVAAELPDCIQNTFYCHNLKTSSSPTASNFPSFISSNTEPLSSARTVCHCPAGTLFGPPGVNSIAYIFTPTHHKTPPPDSHLRKLPTPMIVTPLLASTSFRAAKLTQHLIVPATTVTGPIPHRKRA